MPRFCEENGFYTTRLRSYNMSRIKSKHTAPEKILRKALWHAGIGYRSNRKNLPGKPDITFIKYEMVIFIDGCFWHRHDWDTKMTAIKSNRAFWIPKIERNMQRDREINAYYLSKGWAVLRFWDYVVKNVLGVCVKRVVGHIVEKSYY
ncbi:very short patch repair endonuclease [Anditalea andensis]|uniref:very short patch repair endonuclease n=1 Tax=Anditalea andensis TaxID=1048983 RepID=UPI0005591DBE|nr:very short patch repair endonuclease [Anditalea andensis]